MEAPETPKDTPVAIFTTVHSQYVAPVIAAVVAGLILWQMGMGSPADDLPPIPEDGWLIVIHESALCKAYADNTAIADQHFKGQMIQVAGNVHYRDSQVLESAIFFPDQYGPRLACHFPWNHKSVETYFWPTAQRLVTIRGRCIGLDPTTKIVVMENCGIVKIVYPPR